MQDYTMAQIRTWSRLGSCGAFGIAMLEIAEQQKNLSVLTADLCFYSGLERFRSKYPELFYNFGIAEQNMIGAAAAMAKEGFNVFATTYATFATTRCCDQVKVNMGYMKLPIKLVGLTSGLSVGILGATHMSTEDIAIIRSIPNITILSPADCMETIKVVQAAANINTPVYIRLSGAMNHPIIYKEDYDFTIGTAIKLKDGKDIAIIATGTMVAESLEVERLLKEEGITCSVINMHTIKPIDKKSIFECFNKKLIVTIEEHNKIGGLGSAVAEVLAEEIKKPPQLIIGVEDFYPHAADYSYLLERTGLKAEHIAKKIKNKWNEVKRYE